MAGVRVIDLRALMRAVVIRALVVIALLALVVGVLAALVLFASRSSPSERAGLGQSAGGGYALQRGVGTLSREIEFSAR